MYKGDFYEIFILNEKDGHILIISTSLVTKKISIKLSKYPYLVPLSISRKRKFIGKSIDQLLRVS